eukprot:6496939-Karenia_brevis.AAC.1
MNAYVLRRTCCRCHAHGFIDEARHMSKPDCESFILRTASKFGFWGTTLASTCGQNGSKLSPGRPSCTVFP